MHNCFKVALYGQVVAILAEQCDVDPFIYMFMDLYSGIAYEDFKVEAVYIEGVGF